MQLTSTEEAREFIGGIITTEEDSFILSLVEGVTDYFSAYANLSFVGGTDTFYASTDGVARTVVLPKYPLVAVTSVHDDPTRAFATALVLDTDYVVWESKGVVEMLWRPFYRGVKSVKVVYTHGYGTVVRDGETVVDAPARLKLACLKAVKYLYLKRNHEGATSWSLESSTIAYDATTFPKDVLNLLDSVRVHVSG